MRDEKKWSCDYSQGHLNYVVFCSMRACVYMCVCQNNLGCQVATYSLSDGSIPARGDTSNSAIISRDSLLVGEADEI